MSPPGSRRERDGAPVSPRAAPAGGGNGGRIALTVVIVVGIAALMLVVLRARSGTDPLDPESGRPDGLRGMIELLRQQGVTVDVVDQPPAAGDPARVLILDDRLDDDDRAALEGWIRDGGVAVVADVASPLVDDLPATEVHAPFLPPAQTSATSQANLAPGDCTIGALDALRGVFVHDGVRFEPAAGDGGCFADDDGAFVVSRERGDGVLVAVGDNELWTNALLRYADNGPLATALLAPQPGGAVHLLVGTGPGHGLADVGSGDDTLADLVRPGVWMALVQFAMAFVVFAIARGIRPGRPVDEAVPAPVDGSELVAATGQLMHRARHAARAGWILRGETYRELCHALGVPATTQIAELDALAARRGLTRPGEVGAALGEDVDAADRLVALAARLAELRAAADLTTTRGGP